MESILATIADSIPTSFPLPGDGIAAAAVLVPFVERAGVWSVVLTRRASHLRDHAGQIAFPGGTVEPQDLSPIQTALRETQEEIGLPSEVIKTLGVLTPTITGTGFHIMPVVATVSGDPTFKLEVAEVEEVLLLPLSHLLQPGSFRPHDFLHQGRPYQLSVLGFRQYFIWGATARMLEDLAMRLRKYPHRLS